MRTKIAFVFLFFVLTTGAYPQTCFNDTAKHSCFLYTGLHNQNLVFFPSIWKVQDFAAFYANPNTANSDQSEGPLWIRAVLDADDNSFEYADGCVNPDWDGVCRDTFQFPDDWVNRYTETERFVGGGVQARDAFPACNSTYEWDGSLKVESIEKEHLWIEGSTVQVQDFYNFNPHTFNTGLFGSSTFTSCEDAFTQAWQAVSFDIPVVWDSDINKMVVPYANGWHNTQRWPKGWKTTLTITSFASQSTTFTVENHLVGGEHGHVGDACGTFAGEEKVITKDVSISPGQEKTVNVYDFHFSDPDAVRVWHDTVFYVGVSPLVPGLAGEAFLEPRTSGTSLCSGSNEP